jgi:iron complex outermembrane receptor protein
MSHTARIDTPDPLGRSLKSLPAAVALVMAAMLLHGTNATAQGEQPAGARAIEEIVVTARRREESVQNVPLVIQTFSAEEITRRQISTVADVARYTPGLIVDQGISLQDVRPAIRGLPATRGRPPVGTLVDGIDISTQALGNAGGGNLLNLSLLDLERIEVVKGPQSALYGRAAFAGAVNYVSARPTDELTARVSADVGRFDRRQVSGMVSGPMIADVLAFRVNAAYSEFGGDYANPVSGQDLNGSRSGGASVALEFTPSDVLSVYGRLAYTDDRADQRAIQALSGFTGAVARPGPTTPAGTAIGTAITGGVLSPFALPSNTPVQRNLDFTGVTGLSTDPRTGRDFPGSDSDTLLGTLNVEWDLGAVTLVALTGYARQQDRLTYDGDFYGEADDTFVDGVAEPLELFDVVDFDNDYRQFSQELRLQNFDADGMRWAVGALYWQSRMDQDNNSLRALGGFPFDGFRPPVAGLSGSQLFLNSIDFGVPQGRDIDSWSVYGLVEFDVTDRLTLTAEARYIDEK